MKIRNFLRGLPLAVVALAAVPAAANTFVSAYIYNVVNNGSGAPPLEFIQRLDAPTPGPATASATRPTGTTFSITDYGLQRYYASANLAQLGNQQSSARGQFEDEIVINTGTPGQSGIATFQLRLTGTLFSSNASAAASTGFNWYNPAQSNSFDQWSLTDYGLGLMQVDQILTFHRNYVSGQVMLLSAGWTADASVFLFGPGAGSAYVDFSHTARWLGLQSVVTSGGQNVTNAAVITSNSGFDYNNAAPGVPEPAVWAQMLAGFGLAGGAIRARRRKTA
ncbi:PEPxxWA-CTERM sorting domain-containing protein [Polymorphobacter arshaanensis]|nr:PEPxxWA-CTERM sorting domain-containing protein [Polymorphobacter arshaanensis]